MDKHAYWVYRAKILQNQSFEFRSGVQNPTIIGYMFNTDNDSMLHCLKTYAMHNQGAVMSRLKELVREAIDTQPPDKTVEQLTLFFGPYTYTVIVSAILILISICAISALLDYVIGKYCSNCMDETAQQTSATSQYEFTQSQSHTALLSSNA